MASSAQSRNSNTPSEGPTIATRLGEGSPAVSATEEILRAIGELSSELRIDRAIDEAYRKVAETDARMKRIVEEIERLNPKAKCPRTRTITWWDELDVAGKKVDVLGGKAGDSGKGSSGNDNNWVDLGEADKKVDFSDEESSEYEDWEDLEDAPELMAAKTEFQHH
jgi:hypothetical protein